MTSLLTSQYTQNSAEAFALYKVMQSFGVSMGYAVSTTVDLYWQLLVLAISAMAGSIGFFMVEHESRNRIRNSENRDFIFLIPESYFEA